MCDDCGGIHDVTRETCEEHQAQLDQIREPCDLTLEAYSIRQKRKKR